MTDLELEMLQRLEALEKAAAVPGERNRTVHLEKQIDDLTQSNLVLKAQLAKMEQKLHSFNEIDVESIANEIFLDAVEPLAQTVSTLPTSLKMRTEALLNERLDGVHQKARDAYNAATGSREAAIKLLDSVADLYLA